VQFVHGRKQGQQSHALHRWRQRSRSRISRFGVSQGRPYALHLVDSARSHAHEHLHVVRLRQEGLLKATRPSNHTDPPRHLKWQTIRTDTGEARIHWDALVGCW